MNDSSNLWGRRLKAARTAAMMSQKTVGIKAGLDEFVASSRINRYELGVHKADLSISSKLAEILNVPTSYFYTEQDDLAELAVIFHRSNTIAQHSILDYARAYRTTDLADRVD